MRISSILIPVISIGMGFVLFTSCQEEIGYDLSEDKSVANDIVKQEVVLSAYYENDGNTKTSYEPVSGHILWSPGDQISLFYGSGSGGGSCFTATNDEPVQRTQFSGTIGVITGITENTDDYSFWGIYPYSSQNSCDGSSVTTVVPHEQTGVAETFNEGEFVSIGKSSGLVMGFYNLCGAFYVKVTRSDITKITLRGLGSENLAGRVKISMSTGTPIVSEVLDAHNEITLTRPNGAPFTPGVGYFITCLPTRFNDGFYFEMETSGGLYARKQYDIDFTLGRNRFQAFNATIDSGATFITKVQQNNEIRYTTTDGTLLTTSITAWSYLDPYDSDYDEEASLVSHRYVNGIGIMTFSSNIVCAGFTYNYDSSLQERDRDRLLTVSFPSQVRKISSFNHCANLRKVILLGEIQNTGNPFTLCPELELFESPNAIGDGELLVVNHKAIALTLKDRNSFYTYDYSPGLITSIGSGFASGSNLADVFLSGIEEIDAGAFSLCTSLSDLIIYGCTERIRDRAFYGCTALTSLTLYAPLTYIGDNAFCGCSNLENIDLPSTLTTIGESAFSSCTALTNITLPSSLTTIQAGAFQGSGLTSVVIPASVTGIGEASFACQSMESATVCSVTPPSLLYWQDDDSYSFSPDPFTYHFHPVSYPIYVPKNSLSSYLADSDWSKYSSRLQAMSIIQFMDPAVKSICVANWDANYDGELSQSEAEAVSSLGTVFRNTNITAFPELNAFSGLTTISNSAFSSCSQLTEVALPPTIVTIGTNAFANTSNLRKIILPTTLRTIQESAFSASDVRELWTLPSGVQTIGNSAFSNCKMSRMIIPNTVTSIGNCAFEYCSSLRSLSLPTSLSAINEFTFTGTGITSVTIPASVASIGWHAFANCTSLTTVNCLRSTPPTIEYSGNVSIFYGISNFTIYVSNTSAYRNAAGWSIYQDKISYKKF